MRSGLIDLGAVPMHSGVQHTGLSGHPSTTSCSGDQGWVYESVCMGLRCSKDSSFSCKKITES